MRLGIVDSVGNNLAYHVVDEGASWMPRDIQGQPGQVWLQPGCRRYVNGVIENRTGRWASPDERIGEVQCCLPTRNVCTRDGCLSGRDNTTKRTFFEAEKLCKDKGWQLCSSSQMNNQRGWLSCCVSTAPCGHYNRELVWTSSRAGLQMPDGRGRLFNDVAMLGVKRVTVDLGSLQAVRGIQMQGGVPGETPYTPTCVVETLMIPT